MTAERSLRVLVTGAAGYIGSVLVEELLAAGFRVTALDDLRYGDHGLFHLCANPSFEFVCGDARDERLLRPLVAEADVLVPLAAVVGAPACERDPHGAASINRDAIALLDRLRSQAQLVVYPNTNSGYGAAGQTAVCTEDSPLEPLTLYGRTKVEAERILREGGNAIVFRLATVFGASPRMRLDLLVNHFVYAAVTEGSITIFEKDFRRNYVHVRDVVAAFLHAIGNRDAMAGQVFNLGLDEANCSKEELALAIKQHVPGFHVHCAPIGEDPDKRDYIVSSERLRRAGFTASRTLDQGIRELLKAYALLGRRRYANVHHSGAWAGAQR